MAMTVMIDNDRMSTDQNVTDLYLHDVKEADTRCDRRSVKTFRGVWTIIEVKVHPFKCSNVYDGIISTTFDLTMLSVVIGLKYDNTKSQGIKREFITY